MNNYIIHFGIKRKSGRYPYGSGEKPYQGEKQYTNNQQDNKGSKKGLSDKQKKAIKIGVAVVGTAMLAYGGYRLFKSGKLDNMIKTGKDIISKHNDIDAPSLINNKMKHSESMAESLVKSNPLKGTLEGRNNCTHCAITGFLRTNGIDVVAKNSGGVPKDLGNVVEDCFENSKVLRGNAGTFGKSVDSAKGMLLKRFGNNASGVVSVDWKRSNSGHAFNWIIKDGKVRFFDFQTGKEIGSEYWTRLNSIDSNGNLTLARLDGLKVKDTIKNIVK